MIPLSCSTARDTHTNTSDSPDALRRDAVITMMVVAHRLAYALTRRTAVVGSRQTPPVPAARDVRITNLYN